MRYPWLETSVCSYSSGLSSNGDGASGAVLIIWGAGREFPSTGTLDQFYIRDDDTFLVNGLGGDLTKSGYVQAVNLFDPSNASNIVLVQKDDGVNPSTSHKCVISELTAKADNTHWMLLNRGNTSYKVRVSNVVLQLSP